MIISKNLKKILVASASLVMLASAGAGASSIHANADSNGDAEGGDLDTYLNADSGGKGYEHQTGYDSPTNYAIEQASMAGNGFHSAKTQNALKGVIAQYGKKNVMNTLKHNFGKKTYKEVANSKPIRHFNPRPRTRKMIVRKNNRIHNVRRQIAKKNQARRHYIRNARHYRKGARHVFRHHLNRRNNRKAQKANKDVKQLQREIKNLQRELRALQHDINELED